METISGQEGDSIFGAGCRGGSRGGFGGIRRGRCVVDIVWFAANLPGNPLIDGIQSFGKFTHSGVGRSAAISRAKKSEEGEREDGGHSGLARSSRL